MKKKKVSKLREEESNWGGNNDYQSLGICRNKLSVPDNISKATNAKCILLHYLSVYAENHKYK